MPTKPHRAIRGCRTSARKFSGRCVKGRCESCGKEIPICQAYSYIDPDNGAITNSAPYLCAECYEKRYGSRPLTDSEATQQRIAKRIYELSDQFREHNMVESANVLERVAGMVRKGKF